jgi:hypothetical protein
MKPRSLLGLLCMVAIVFAACQKDKAVLASGTLTFTFDSTAYSANTSTAYKADTTSEYGKKIITIEGVTGDLAKHIAISVFFPDTLTTGTFTEANGATILFSPSLGQVTSYLSTTATIKITSINSKYAEGTFFGTLNNGEVEKPLTDGTFKVNIY